MNKTPWRTWAESVKNGLSDFSDFLARLTAWRFLGLCLLLMIAVSIAQDLLPGQPSPHRSIHAIKEKSAPTPPAGAQPADEISDAPDADPSQAGKAGNGPKMEIHIGDGRIVMREGNKVTTIGDHPAASGEPDDDNVDAEDTVESSPDLQQYALFLIVLMLIARTVASAKLKAEARTVVAQDLAERETLSRQLAESRLQAMQAQVEPHFLFNTLAAVEHLIETDPPRAAKMQGNLIGYLRAVMPNFRKPESTLGREVDICRHYLDILKVRMEDRLQVEIDIPPALENAPLPPLMLQSLVENAIRHGLEPKPAGGSLHIHAAAVAGRLAVTVIDTGTGFANTTSHGQGGGGVGLGSIRERLAALFGERGRLTITPNIPHGTQVRLEVPYPDQASTDKGSGT